MKNKILIFLLSLMALPCWTFADNFFNLTPLPRNLTIGKGELVLPGSFIIATRDLPEEMIAEVQKFAEVYQRTTGTKISLQANADQALFQLSRSAADLKEEGYKLNITETGVTIEANTPVGLYYAFQSIKKMLPPNVMAGVFDKSVTKYVLPTVRIYDYPQFGYRGFMLDTSRHFFSVDELKRVLEVMSYYKMNRFHWHMTDDQGWRVEIKKYPRLTSVGSISDNSYMVDMQHGDYWLNRPYGPLFYTQEQVKEVVAFARERHIDIIPEIDMPGHFSAAMAAYPEYSCNPDGGHGVVSNIGGVYSDVLNVANEAAVQFAKDILTEIMDLFPGEYIHVGGDECPTTAWENNAECIAKKEALGLSSFRELQSHFIKDMADHLRANGRKIAVWNEAISARGADTRTIKETGATVFCWTGADGAVAKAASLGLDHVYTPQVPWYINRRQSTDASEPVGAGRGTDNLEVVYKQQVPVPNARYFSGVQATFWSEYVAFGDYLEYLMLPRLVAIAEAGWTPKGKMNFENFCQRITADSALYNYNHYHYGKHYMKNAGNSGDKVMPNISTSTKPYWYRLVTQAEGERSGKCIELLSATSPLIGAYQGKGAAEGRLWTNAQALENDAAYNYQFWALEEDGTHPGHYALVCKARPEGSLSPIPTAKNNGGRWQYDNQVKHYHFILADNGYGQSGDSYYYSIRCDQIDGLWLNASLVGQGYAVNLYGKPSDGNGGLWKFVSENQELDTDSIKEVMREAERYLMHVRTYSNDEEKRPGYFGAEETRSLQQLMENVDLSSMNMEELSEFSSQLKVAYRKFRNSFGFLESGGIYVIQNTVPGYQDISLSDDQPDRALRHTSEIWSDNAWTVTSASINDDFSQFVKLQNVQTKRFVGEPVKQVTSRFGFAVNTARQGAEVLCTFLPETQEFLLSIDGKNLYPVLEKSSILPGVVCAGADTQSGNAIRPQGAAWNFVESRVVVFDCYDDKGGSLGTFRRSWPLHEMDESLLTPPEIKHYKYVEKQGEKSIYKRSTYGVRLICQDDEGALLAVKDTSCAVGDSYTLDLPDIPFYTLEESSNYHDGEKIQLTADLVICATYSTNAFNGVRKLGPAVTSLKAGHSYVLYDMSPQDGARKGYRNVNENLQVMRNHHIEGTLPGHTWILESVGSNFKVKNSYYQLYVPLLQNSRPALLGKMGGIFAFSLNPDGESWKIKGSNGVCWDGLGSGALVGWNDPGHPYKIYEYYVQPYFQVTVEMVDVKGKTLFPEQTSFVKAGEGFTLVTPSLEGYILKEVQGSDDLKSVSDHVKVRVVYADQSETGIETLETGASVDGIYDLTGRRLERVSHRGIYIVNGRKFLVK